MTTSNISISNNRVAVEFNDQTIQFVAWDLEEKQHSEIKDHIVTAFSLCGNFSEIEKHMLINGYEFELEDIYEN